MSRRSPLVVEDVEDAQWDDTADLVVVGLGAAGVCSRQYVSGLSLADCVYSGRRAARHATGQKQGGFASEKGTVLFSSNSL